MRPSPHDAPGRDRRLRPALANLSDAPGAGVRDRVGGAGALPVSRDVGACAASSTPTPSTDAASATPQHSATPRAWAAELRRISALHAELAAATHAFAEKLERDLAAGAHPRLMCSMEPNTIAPPSPPSPTPELLNCNQLAALLQIHPRTLRRMRAAGEVPPPIKVGDAERWRRTTVEGWIAEREERAK